ncbi:MAG: hypothetical protein Q9227_000340 [Pyrenula ochraceoflavens]
MLPPFDYIEHLRACQFKQKQREERFAHVGAAYKGSILASERSILSKPIAELVQDVHKQILSPLDVLRAYGKVAVKAQEKTNCITELMLPEAEEWATTEVDLNGPLAGIPISFKDTVAVKGFDVTVGYSRYVGQPYPEDGVQVKLYKKSGAIPYVKTAVPITLLSFESTNSVWGTARNPHNPAYSPGGSTGGEAALLALGGRIGIGTDVAGSVRVPAAWCGIHSLRCSTGRWPKGGMNTSMPGQEGVPSVFSPMARTLDDLTYFARSLISMQPWKYDYTVHPIPWRDVEIPKKLKVGLISSDGVVPPSPAIARGLKLTADALERSGNTVQEVSFPDAATPAYGLQIASVLLNADGGKTWRSFFRTFEFCDPGASQLEFYMSIPSPLRYIYYLYVRYIRRDSLWASLLRNLGPLSSVEQWKWVAKRELFRATWFDWWSQHNQSYDFILCPVNATPALPHGAMKDAVSSCGYTFLWNLLDYTAGVMPVTKVDPVKDQLHDGWKAPNCIAKGAYRHYNSHKMAGLPCAIQVVGRRLEEEKVLKCMMEVENSLKAAGQAYEGLEVE